MLPLRSTLLLVLLAGTFLPPDAAALVQCAKVRASTGEIRNGTPVRLREVCKSSEVQVELTGPMGEAGFDGLSCWDLNESFTCEAEEDIAAPLGCGVEDCLGGATSPGVALVDADGVEIGTIDANADLSSSVRVVRDVGGVGVQMLATQFGLAPTDNREPTIGDFYFDEPGCQGHVYVLPVVFDSGGFYAETFRGGTRTGFPSSSILHRAPQIEDFAPGQIASRLTNPGGTGFVCQALSSQVNGIVRIDALDPGQFTPPFSLTTLP